MTEPIVEKAYTDVPYSGREVPARLVLAEKGDRRQAITYWFASGKRTEASYVKQQALMAVDRLQAQKYGWAFIRVDTAEWQGHEEALATTRAFLKDIDKPLAELLSGGD